MGFSSKLLMGCLLLLVLMPAILAHDPQNGTITNSSVDTHTVFNTTANPISEKIIIVKLPPTVGTIKVKWDPTNSCQGDMFFMNFTHEKHLCWKSHISTTLGRELCRDRRCGEFVGIKDSGKHRSGYMIHENLTVTNEKLCSHTFLTCKDKPVYNKELVIYKVITALLLMLIIVVLLSRCAQPAYKAFRKRFSQKRQNRWIGPTQSQSVSYHRGQTNNPNNNTMKRQSYPGLERLSVNPSREPSSNRNSDYDSYGI